jgi:hypothetical protein
VTAGDLVDVGSGDEDIGLGRAQDQDADVGAGASARQQLVELGEHLAQEDVRLAAGRSKVSVATPSASTSSRNASTFSRFPSRGVTGVEALERVAVALVDDPPLDLHGRRHLARLERQLARQEREGADLLVALVVGVDAVDLGLEEGAHALVGDPRRRGRRGAGGTSAHGASASKFGTSRATRNGRRSPISTAWRSTAPT